jgi:hypothetical protein
MNKKQRGGGEEADAADAADGAAAAAATADGPPEEAAAAAAGNKADDSEEPSISCTLNYLLKTILFIMGILLFIVSIPVMPFVRITYLAFHGKRFGLITNLKSEVLNM